MNFKNLCMAKAVLCVVLGIVCVVAPVHFIKLYGPSLTDGGALITQLFGASLILIAVTLWFVKGVEASQAQNAITLGVFVGDLIGTVVNVIAVIGGVLNALGWLNVVLYLVLTAGFGYLRFFKRAAA